jgi:hypothetical protein
MYYDSLKLIEDSHSSESKVRSHIDFDVKKLGEYK